jgi:hypothetical protein
LIYFKKVNRRLKRAWPSRFSNGRLDGAPQLCVLRVAQHFFKLTEFNIRCWTFNVRCSTFISLFFDKIGLFLAVSWADTRNPKP